MRAMVTGASGFIGGRLVAALDAAPAWSVRALVRPTSQRPSGIECVEGDITRPETLAAAVDGADVVFHLASLLKVPWKPAFAAVNVDGTANVAAACAGAARPPVLVVVSSLAAAGPAPREPSPRPRREVDPPRPISRYGRVKRAAEQAAVAGAGAAPVSIVRPPMVFGAGDRGALPLFRGAARGWHLAPGDGSMRMGLVHVDDLAAALIAIAARGERVPPGADGGDGAGVYQVAADEAPSYAELGRLVGEAAGTSTRVLRVPRPVVGLVAAASEMIGRLRDRPTVLNRDKHREGSAGDWWCSNDRVRALGWAPGPLGARLRETVEGYRAAGWRV